MRVVECDNNCARPQYKCHHACWNGTNKRRRQYGMHGCIETGAVGEWVLRGVGVGEGVGVEARVSTSECACEFTYECQYDCACKNV